jgi:hypothetical protein
VKETGGIIASTRRRGGGFRNVLLLCTGAAGIVGPIHWSVFRSGSDWHWSVPYLVRIREVGNLESPRFA